MSFEEDNSRPRSEPPSSLGSPDKLEDPASRVLLSRLDANYAELRKDFKDWKIANREDKKGIFHRLAELEEKALYIPNEEEVELIKEAAEFYRTKRKFRERLYSALLEKGITGMVLFTLTALFFYIKHLLTGAS